MLQSRHHSSHPKVRFESHRFGRVLAVRTLLEPGHWVETTLPACGGYKDIDNASVQISGTTIDDEGILRPRSAGWCSRTDTDRVDAERVVRRVALSPVEQWCIRMLDRSQSMSHVDVRLLSAGEILDLHPGNEVLVMAGEWLENGAPQKGRAHITAKADDVRLVAVRTTYIAVWPSDL